MQLSSLKMIPRISEKAYDLSEKRNTYVFEIPKSVNKISVVRAVQEQYKVSVISVNTSTVHGKSKKTYRKNGQKTYGSRPDTKKAYVVLKKGDSISIFAGKNDSEKNNKSSKKDKK